VVSIRVRRRASCQVLWASVEVATAAIGAIDTAVDLSCQGASVASLAS
jgi:hypothetical protein